jgi:dipeptidyl aminopeptidase/acylaminoacyl peptidase
MKKRMSALVVIVAIVAVGFAVRALSTSTPASSAHRELVQRLDSKTSKVELFWDAPPSANKKLPAIVYVHGVQGEDRPGAMNLVKGGVLSATAKLGYFAAAMSMPGYGQSSGEGDFCGRSTQIALQSTVAYLRNRPDIDADRIAVTGFSCGAVAAAMIADKEPLAAMILISGNYDFEDMYAKWHTPAWQLQPEVMAYIDKCVATDGGLQTAAKYRSSLPHAGQFKMPLLVVAGGKDRIADNTQGAALSKAMQSNGHANRFILNPEGEHMVPYEDWIKYSTEFLRESSSKR